MRAFNMLLMSAFAVVALVLASIGLYGVITFAVGQRRREIGLRQAIGASRSSIYQLIFGSALRMIVPGVLLGFCGALILGRVIAAQLYGVGPADPLLLLTVVIILVATALVACLLPSVQASRITPMAALRDE
jgi:putative ABC transport system permease protein